MALLRAGSGLDWTATNNGVSGYTVADLAVNLATVLTGLDSATTSQIVVLINIGANDANPDHGWPQTEATWKANYLAVIDEILLRRPSALIYLTKPWDRPYPANCATLAGWIVDIVAARPGGHVFVGDNEAVWLEGGDDGATMTTDGIHYSAAGNVAKAAQMKQIILPQ